MDDLQNIYSDDYLKFLLTVSPIGEKFGILIDEDGNIKGGITGYTEGQGAMIQMIKVKETSQRLQLLEGLLRATIYMLERENVKTIFLKKAMGNILTDDILRGIGFRKVVNPSNLSGRNIGDLMLKEIANDSYSFLDVNNFFNHSCSC